VSCWAARACCGSERGRLAGCLWALAIAAVLRPCHTGSTTCAESPLPEQRPSLLGPDPPCGIFEPRCGARGAFALYCRPGGQFHLSTHLPLFRNQLGFSRTAGGVAGPPSGNRGALGSRPWAACWAIARLPSHAPRCVLGVGGLTSRLSACQGLVGGLSLQLAYTTGEGILVGVVYATSLALFMNLTNPACSRHAIPGLQPALRGVGCIRSGDVAERMRRRPRRCSGHVELGGGHRGLVTDS